MAKFRFGHYINIHWNGYDIKGDGGTIFSIPDQLYEEFEGDIRPVEPSLEWTDTNEFQTLTNSVTASTITGLAPIVATATSTGKQISISSGTAQSGYVLAADGSGAASFVYSSGGSGGGVAVVGTSPISVVTAAGTATVSLNANYSTSTHLHDADYVNVTGDTMSGQLYVSSATTTTTVGFGEIIIAKGTSYGSVTVNAADDHIHIRSKNPIEILQQSTSAMQGLRARGLSVNSTHTYPTLIDDGITFGEDANLYRSAANALKTDDDLEVVGSLTNGGTSVSLSTHTHAYQTAGTYVTSVAGTAPIVASTTTAGAATVSVSTGTTSSTVALGNHTHATSSITSGNYVATLAAGTGVTVTGADANSAAKTVSIGQAVATNSTPTFAGITINGTLTGNKSAHTSINQGIMVTATATTITTTTQPATPSTANTQLISWSGAAKANTGIWTSGGSMTLPVAGMYQFVFGSRFGSGTAYGVAVYAFQNTTLRHNIAKDASAVSSLDAIEMTGMIYAAANDTLSIRVAASAASKTLSALTFLGVMYMGDF
jgi:hypothetical protein